MLFSPIALHDPSSHCKAAIALTQTLKAGLALPDPQFRLFAITVFVVFACIPPQVTALCLPVLAYGTQLPTYKSGASHRSGRACWWLSNWNTARLMCSLRPCCYPRMVPMEGISLVKKFVWVWKGNFSIKSIRFRVIWGVTSWNGKNKTRKDKRIIM